MPQARGRRPQRKWQSYFLIQKPEKPILHICGLGASVGCERISEHSTRRDENHKYAVLVSQVSSVLFIKMQKFLKKILAF